MAGAIVQSAYAVDDSGTTTTSIAVTINGVSTGAVLDAHIGFSDSGTITCTVSDGTSYTADAKGKMRDTTISQSGQNFYRPNVSSGNYTVTATFSASTGFRRIRVHELSGLATSSVEDQAQGQVQTSPGTGADGVSSTASSATTNANDFIVGLTQDTLENDPGTGTLTAGTGYTISGSNIIMGVESKNVSATGAQTATFTQSVNNNRITHVIAFKHLATSVPRLMMMGVG